MTKTSSMHVDTRNNSWDRLRATNVFVIPHYCF